MLLVMCPRFYATLNYDLVVLTNRLLFINHSEQQRKNPELSLVSLYTSLVLLLFDIHIRNTKIWTAVRKYINIVWLPSMKNRCQNRKLCSGLCTRIFLLYCKHHLLSEIKNCLLFYSARLQFLCMGLEQTNCMWNTDWIFMQKMHDVNGPSQFYLLP